MYIIKKVITQNCTKDLIIAGPEIRILFEKIDFSVLYRKIFTSLELSDFSQYW